MATFTADSAANIDLDTDAVINVDSGVTVTLSGIVSGATRLQKTGDGTAILTGTNTYTGGLTIDGGILQVAGEDQLGAVPAAVDADNLILNSGTLNFTGTTDVTLNSNRGITVSAASTIDVDINDGSRGGELSYDGVFTGTAGLTISGGDNVNYLPTLSLTGDSSAYGETWTITEGVNFEVNGTGHIAGAVALSGDLKGDGTITGTVTSTGGRLSPGSTVGSSMTINGDLVLDANSELYFGLDESTTGNFDFLTVNSVSGSLGDVTLAGTITLVPYISTLTNGSIGIIRAGSSIVSNTATLVTFAGYADGDEDVTTLGTLTNTYTGAVDTTTDPNFDLYAVTIA